MRIHRPTIEMAMLVLGILIAAPASSFAAGNAGKIAAGKSLYAKNCAQCHGANLEGHPDWKIRKPDGRLPAPPHDKTGHTWHHPDQHLFRMTKFGITPPLAPKNYQSDMPAFEEVLSDDEIWSVLVFIKSTWPVRYRDRQRGISEQADDK